jgi:outer membrane protein assembly factor BamD
MSTSFTRALSSLALFGFALALSPLADLRADLVWTPQTGWKAEGGVLAGALPEPDRNALDSMNKARADEERGRRSAAMSRYEGVAKKYPNSVYAAEALFRSAHIRYVRRQYVKAFDSFQDVVSKYPNSPRFNSIIGEQYLIANALLEGKRPRYFGWIPGFKNRTKGIEFFEKIVETAPHSEYAPMSLMNVARGHQKLGQPDEAIDALDRMINDYQQNLLAPDAYLKLAQTHASLVQGPAYDQASTQQAITYYQDFLILFPSDTNVPSVDKGLTEVRKTFSESKIVIGDFYFYKRDNFKAARVLYNEAITAYPDSAVAEVARQRLAAVEKKETKAKAAALPPAPETPRPKPKRSFWLF